MLPPSLRDKLRPRKSQGKKEECEPPAEKHLEGSIHRKPVGDDKQDNFLADHKAEVIEDYKPSYKIYMMATTCMAILQNIRLVYVSFHLQDLLP